MQISAWRHDKAPGEGFQMDRRVRAGVTIARAAIRGDGGGTAKTAIRLPRLVQADRRTRSTPPSAVLEDPRFYPQAHLGERRVDEVEAGVVPDVQQPVDLRRVTAERPGELRLGHLSRPHLAVERDLEGDARRQRDRAHGGAARAWGGDVLTVGDAGLDGGLERIGGMAPGVGLAIAEGDGLGKVRKRHQDGAVIVV